jgi:hypothetical protein
VRAAKREDLNMHLGRQIAGMIDQVRPAHVVLEMVPEAVEVLGELQAQSKVSFSKD